MLVVSVALLVARKARANQAAQARLQAGLEDTFTPDFEGLASMLSTFVWGMIIAKAKQGFGAVKSTNSSDASTSVKKAGMLVGLIAVALLIKVGAESSAVKSALHLQATPAMDETLNLAKKQVKTVKAPAKANSVQGFMADFHKADKNTKKQLLAEMQKEAAAVKEEEEQIRLAEEEVLAEQERETRRAEFQKRAPVIGSFLGGMVIVGCAIGYTTLLKKHNNALQKYEKLIEIYNNPNARVVPKERAEEVLAKVMPKQPEPEAPKMIPVQALHHPGLQLPPQLAFQQPMQYVAPMPAVEKTEVKVEAPTEKNLPKDEKKEEQYHYSMCDSVDYQKEVEAPKYTAEQVQAMLAQQKQLFVQQAPVAMPQQMVRAIPVQMMQAPQPMAMPVQQQTATLRYTAVNNML